MSLSESQSPQASADFHSALRKWTCPGCPKVFNTPSGRTVHMRKYHEHLAPCSSCNLPKCILTECLVRKHCHGGEHGGTMQRLSPPVSESSSSSGDGQDSDLSMKSNVSAMVPEWQVQHVAVAEELWTIDLYDFEDALMAIRGGQVPAGGMWPEVVVTW